MTSSKCNRQRNIDGTKQDTTQWNEWTVDHEINLCTECLYGTPDTGNGFAIEGLYDRAKVDYDGTIKVALKVWKKRYDNAWDEKIHRILLGEWHGVEASSKK